MDISSSKLDNILLSTQITAISIVGDFIYIGEGQVLHLYNLNNSTYYASVQVFTAAVIHGIKLLDNTSFSDSIARQDHENSSDSSKQDHILIWGQKSIAVVKVVKYCKELEIILTERNVEDWIIDVSQDATGNLVIATAHNKLLSYCLKLWKSHQDNINKKEIKKKPNEETLYYQNTCNVKDDCVLTKSECSENCILYCGYLDVQGNYEDSLLLAGTVFSQVLIWGPMGEKDENGKIIPIHRISGHQGVLFSIRLSSEKNILTTTSDDRTLRIWNIEHKGVSQSFYSYWANAIITEKHTCYGHSARVWKSIILPDIIVTIGEDSQIIVWDYEGRQINSWKAHEGSSIWCVAANDGLDVSPGSVCSKLVTGGDDGSVRIWSLRSKEKEKLSEISNLPWKDQSICSNEITTKYTACTNKIVSDPMNKEKYYNTQKENSGECENITSDRIQNSKNNPKKDFPRCVCLLGRNCAYLMLDSGKLYNYNIGKNMWKLVFKDERYKSYSVLESSLDQKHLVLANLYGNAIILQKEENGSLKEICTSQLYQGKIFALKWLSDTLIISSASEGCIDLWNLQEGSFDNYSRFILPPSKQRWLAAACIIIDPISFAKSFLICGDRAGSLHLYVLDNSNSIHTLKSIHGKNGVTSLNLHHDCIYSSGRDGFIRCFTIEAQQLKSLSVIKIGGGSWVAGVMFPYNNPLALVFHDKNLQVYNIDEGNVLATVECGGGHRSWDLFMSKEVLVFLFVKDTVPYIYEFNIKENMNTIVKSALHSREITSLLPIFNHSNDLVFITSSEDTTLRLHSTKHAQERQTISIIKSHISNVRTLCHIQNTSNTDCDEECNKDSWIVSAGGRAQVKVWHIKDNRSNENNATKVPLNSLSVACQEMASHMIRTGSAKTWKCQEPTFDPETRYMDAEAWWLKQGLALLVLASSDGALRFFNFSSIVGELTLLHTEDSSRCMLQVKRIDVPGSHLIISTDTGGQVIVWDIKNVVNAIMNRIEHDSVRSSDIQIGKIFHMQLHQSGINAVGLMKLNSDKQVKPCQDVFHLATAGDDNQLNICKMTVTNPNSSSEMGCPKIEISKLASVNAHSSQITGLSWLSSGQLVTASIDQRLVVWQLTQTLQNTSLTSSNSAFTGVSDIKGCTTISKLRDEQKDIKILLYGAGLQIYSLTDL